MGGLAVCHSSCAALVQWAICFNEPGSEEERVGGVLLRFVLNGN